MIKQTGLDLVGLVLQETNMSITQDWPKSFELYISTYGFKDTQEIYTNGSELIPKFRVMDGWSHYSTELRNKYDKQLGELRAASSELFKLSLDLLNQCNPEDINLEILSKLDTIHQDLIYLGTDI